MTKKDINKTPDLTSFLLNYVKAKPGMYLHSPKLLHLNIFITGYRISQQNIISEKTDRFLEYFNDWFIKKTKGNKFTLFYPSILDECNHSEKKALLKFWEYLEEFDNETKLSLK